jgi:hypothetical protein
MPSTQQGTTQQPGMRMPSTQQGTTQQPGMRMPSAQQPGTEPMEQPYMNYPSYQGIPNVYLPNTNPYGAPMGIPLYPLYGYDNSSDLDRDAEYMKQLYPNLAKAIQSAVDNECDQMEYDGSLMFDEYPDKVSLDRIIDRIYEQFRDTDEEPRAEIQSLYFYPPVRSGNHLRDIVSLLLLSEIFNRRRRYRSRRFWF